MSGKGFFLLLVPRGTDPRGVREFRVSGSVLIGLITLSLAIVVTFVAVLADQGLRIVDQIKFSRLQKENTILQEQLAEMNRTVLGLVDQMAIVAERDDAVRLSAELDPLPEELRRAGIGGSRRDFDRRIMYLSGEAARLAMDTQTKLNRLSRELKLEMESLLEVGERLEAQKEFLRGFPSIFPVNVSANRAWVSSPFGVRDDPIYGDRRFHYGNDIGAARGTPVAATADGIIVKLEGGIRGATRRGMGNYVRIDHGNGYETVYAHLDRLGPGIRMRTRVKRGDIIGYVGNTGRTNGIHLHYQVEFNGKPVNPYYHYYDRREAEVLGNFWD